MLRLTTWRAVPKLLILVGIVVVATGLILWAVDVGSPAVDPDVGETNVTEFTWSVLYLDDTADPAATAQISLLPPGGDWGDWIDMTADIIGDPTDGGLEYSYTSMLDTVGLWQYRFQFVDVDANSTIFGPYDGPDVNTPPNPPTNLHMFPAPGTGTGIVAGTINTTFTFFATMPSDPDLVSSDPDIYEFVELYLHLKQGGAWLKKLMEPVAGVGAGAEYYATVDRVNESDPLNPFGGGDWEWYVEAKDAHDPPHDNTTESGEPYEEFKVVFTVNPTLSVSGVSISPDDGPTSYWIGSGSSTYTFRVLYKHAGGLPPRAFCRYVRDPWTKPLAYPEGDLPETGVKTGLLLWIQDHESTPALDHFSPHFMAPETVGATPEDYVSGVWYRYTVRPESFSGRPPFVPASGESWAVGQAYNNFYSSLGTADMEDWGLEAKHFGITDGTVKYYAETTADYRPADVDTPATPDNHENPSAEYTLGNDILAGSDPTDYSVARISSPYGGSHFDVLPVTSRGGYTNDLLDDTTAWEPGAYHGATASGTPSAYWPMPNYGGGGGHSRGTDSMTYEFWVRYFAEDGVEPWYVAVYIDDQYHAMYRATGAGLPSDERDGVWYTCTTSLPPGEHQYYVKAFNGQRYTYFPRRPAGGSGHPELQLRTQPVNHRPELSNGAISPVTGDEDTVFTYSVTYTDADGDTPRYAYVDILDSELQPPGVTGTIEGGGAGVIWDETPPPDHWQEDQLVGYYVKIIKDTVSPLETARGKYFPIVGNDYDAPNSRWKIRLANPEDDPLWLVAGGEEYVIVYRGAMQPAGGDFAAGVEYTFEFNQYFIEQEPRTFRYAFTFADHWGWGFYGDEGELGEYVNLPAGDRFGVEGGFLPGPLLEPANQQPVLSAPETSPITTDPLPDLIPSVDPNEHSAAATYRFRVKYTDPDGDFPTTIQMGISDTAGGGIYGSFDDWMNLQEEDSDDTDVKDGKLYYAELKLLAMASPSAYAHTFRAHDGDLNAQLDSSYFTDDGTGSLGKLGPTVHPNQPPTLSEGSVSPEISFPDETITYSVTYTDADDYGGMHGNPPEFIKVYIDGFEDDDAQDMEPVDAGDADYTDGREYQFVIDASALGVGEHRYFFLTSDSAELARMPDSGFNIGPTISNEFSISGIVTSGGVPLPGVEVSADGHSAITGGDGTYSIEGLVFGIYAVLPTLPEYEFTPASQDVTVNDALGDAAGVDFEATQKTYSISGTVTSEGLPLAGVEITADGHTDTTGPVGTYSISGLTAGTYTVTPSASGYAFTPPSPEATVNETVGDAAGLDFVGTRIYSISGTVTNAGGPLAGVEVTADGQSDTTGPVGTYSISGLTAGTYTVTPSLTEYEFTLPSQEATVNETVGDAAGIDFVGTQKTYSISGTVTSEGLPLAGVEMTADGHTGTTGPVGTYSISGLTAGTYTVTPSLTEYEFTPPSQEATVNETVGDAAGIDFVGARTYSISGIVTNAGDPLAGVEVSADGQSDTTGADGTYEITGLLAGTYTVTPTLSEYEFAPTDTDVTVNVTEGDATVDFVGTQKTYTISGTVTKGGAGLAGVEVTADGNTDVTEADGTYSISGLLAGTYTVTPSLTEHDFTLPSANVTVNEIQGDATGVDFTATDKTYSISGTVTNAGVPLPGVEVTADGQSATTVAEGTYTISGLVAGTYIVTSSLAEYTFAPDPPDITVGPDAIDVDFVGTQRTYSISGIVTNAGDPLTGVEVTADGESATTAAEGTYTISGLVAGTYVVTPSLAEYTFEPPSDEKTVNETEGNATGVDFVGTQKTYSISGTIVDLSANPLVGVEVAADGNGDTTGAHGTFAIDGLPAGTYTVTPTLSGFGFTPASQDVTVNETQGHATGVDFTGMPIFTTTLGEGLSMIGVPCTPLEADNPTVLFGTSNVARWNPNISPPDYVMPGDPGALLFLSVAPGKGYFVRMTSERELTVAGIPVPTDAEFLMPLGRTGWHLVANPYPSSLPFANIMTEASGILAYGFVYDSDSGSYLLVTDQTGMNVDRTEILRWEAIWVRAIQSGTLTIEPSASPSQRGEAEPQELAQGEGGWTVRILARVADRADLTSVLGVTTQGAGYQIDNPPSAPETVDLYFSDSQGRRLAYDVRPAGPSEMTWDFVVTTGIADSEVEIRLGDLSEIPNDLSVILTDLDASRNVYIRTMPSYTFQSDADGVSQRHFRLTVAPRQHQGLIISAASAQPSQSGVVIVYSVNKPCSVTIRVLNIAGQLIKTLCSDEMVISDTNATTWSLRSQAGQLVPAGRYLITIDAVGEDGQRVSAIRSTSVVR